ncbi:MAG: endolytic transglycosylase MltG [Sphaerochaetaceae bacterium]
MADTQLELNLGDHPTPKKKRSSPKKNPAKRKPASPRTTGREQAKNLSRPKPKKPAGTASKPRRGDVEPPELGKRKGYQSPISRFALIITLSIWFCLLALVLVTQWQGRRKPQVTEAAPPSAPSETIALSIQAGMSARQVAVLLEDNGVVSSAHDFISYLVSHDLASRLRSGTYLFSRGSSDQTVAGLLTSNPAALSVVVTPGQTLSQVDTYLAQRGYAKEGAFLAAAKALAASEGLSFAEGWFFPGTYPVRDGDVASSLAVAMHQAMLDALGPLSGSDAVRQYGLEAVVIIASMIQAETQNPDEMPLIAGIIYNRLEQGIPLGIDATTRYETGDWEHPFNPAVFEQKSPYNTRRVKGLPPSGISCPGLAALTAAAHPQKTDALFYLHGKDGAIHTAVDYQAHQRNMETYL